MQWEPGKQYRISYTNESSETSVRTIDVLGTSRARDGRLYIRAFCHLRGTERTFRADRVIHAEPTMAAPSPSRRPVPSYTASTPVWHIEREPVDPAPEYVRFMQSQQAASSAPVASAPAAACQKPSGNPVGAFMAALLLIAAGYGSITAYTMNTSGSEPSPYRGGASGAGAGAAVQPAPRPLPPKPALEEAKIAGYTLSTVRTGGTERFEVPELGLVTMHKLEAVSAIRLPAFVAAMGFFNADLAGRYLDADLNGSGRLGFEELKVFQEAVYREFRYMPNELALRPDEFLAAGGGDCEDFALYTAGLLRFWGWEPYIGSLAASRGSTGHAVCLSFEEGAFPKGYTYFDIDEWTTEDGSPLPAGTYVPIDYDHVGSLSNAVGSGWKLRSVYIPEKAWGLSM
jgi:hypothetical protein